LPLSFRGPCNGYISRKRGPTYKYFTEKLRLNLREARFREQLDSSTCGNIGNNSTLLHKSNFKVASCEHGIDVISQFHEILARLTH
jgi:hypothetical protein